VFNFLLISPSCYQFLFRLHQFVFVTFWSSAMCLNYIFENYRLPKLFLFDVVFVFVAFYYFRIFQTCFNFVFILFTRVMVFCIFKLPIELFVTTEEWILFSLTSPEF